MLEKYFWPVIYIVFYTKMQNFESRNENLEQKKEQSPVLNNDITADAVDQKLDDQELEESPIAKFNNAKMSLLNSFSEDSFGAGKKFLSDLPKDQIEPVRNWLKGMAKGQENFSDRFAWRANQFKHSLLNNMSSLENRANYANKLTQMSKFLGAGTEISTDDMDGLIKTISMKRTELKKGNISTLESKQQWLLLSVFDLEEKFANAVLESENR